MGVSKVAHMCPENAEGKNLYFFCCFRFSFPFFYFFFFLFQKYYLKNFCGTCHNEIQGYSRTLLKKSPIFKDFKNIQGPWINSRMFKDFQGEWPPCYIFFVHAWFTQLLKYCFLGRDQFSIYLPSFAFFLSFAALFHCFGNLFTSLFVSLHKVFFSYHS